MSSPARTPRGSATRNKIIQVALHLFAERGIDGVSLNDINKAAGQRNKNATHYHFGSKQGLLQAIFDRHEPALAERRDALLDQFEAEGPLSLRKVLRAIIQPMVEKLDDPDGGADFVRFSAHLVVTHTLAVLEMSAPTISITSVERIARAMDQQLGAMPAAIKLQRGLLLGIFITHSLAEHSRLRASRESVETELFVANLEDSLEAMMLAPVSATTAELMRPPTTTPAN